MTKKTKRLQRRPVRAMAGQGADPFSDQERVDETLQAILDVRAEIRDEQRKGNDVRHLREKLGALLESAKEANTVQATVNKHARNIEGLQLRIAALKRQQRSGRVGVQRYPKRKTSWTTVH